jgi:hypothetical protein
VQAISRITEKCDADVERAENLLSVDIDLLGDDDVRDGYEAGGREANSGAEPEISKQKAAIVVLQSESRKDQGKMVPAIFILQEPGVTRTLVLAM